MTLWLEHLQALCVPQLNLRRGIVPETSLAQTHGLRPQLQRIRNNRLELIGAGS